MRSMLVAQLLAAVERLAPSALAEEWDNVGLLVGRHNQPTRRVLVALELRDEVLGEARETGCDAVLTHHPPIFPALSAVTDAATASELVLRAAEARVAVIAAHTNLDAAAGGLNDVMAEMLGLSPQRALVPSADDPACGLGRVGTVSPTTLGGLVARVRAGFGGAPVSYSGDPFARVVRVACCTGSGGSLIDAARAAEADAYVTSDLRYHDADRSEGLPLVCLPHASAERAAMKRWTKSLERALSSDGVVVRFAEADTDPWQTA
jgi:dinuclear metal center YbgI/SA1388 family protein